MTQRVRVARHNPAANENQVFETDLAMKPRTSERCYRATSLCTQTTNNESVSLNIFQMITMLQRGKSFRSFFGDEVTMVFNRLTRKKKNTRRKLSSLKTKRNREETNGEGRTGMDTELNSNDNGTNNRTHVESSKNPPIAPGPSTGRAARNTTSNKLQNAKPARSQLATADQEKILKIDSPNVVGGNYTISSMPKSHGEIATTRFTANARGISSRPQGRPQNFFTETRSSGTRHIQPKFSSLEEAKVYELYKRRKSKMKELNNNNATKKDSIQSTAGNVSNGICGDCLPCEDPQIDKKRSHLKTKVGRWETSVHFLDSPVLSDWNKTPVTSNRRISHEPDVVGVGKSVMLDNHALMKEDNCIILSSHTELNNVEGIAATFDAANKKKGMGLVARPETSFPNAN